MRKAYIFDADEFENFIREIQKIDRILDGDSKFKIPGAKACLYNAICKILQDDPPPPEKE